MTVSVALLTYRDEDGENRTAFRGETVELDGAELAKAIRLEAVVDGPVEPLPGPVAEPTAPGFVPGDDGVGDAEDLDPERPSNGASKATWAAYAVALGMDTDEAEHLSRDALVARFPAE